MFPVAKTISLFLLLSAFSFTHTFKKFHLSGSAQGTTWMISYYAHDSIISHNHIDSILNKIDSSLSLYKPYSLINTFNNTERGIVVDHHFINVINKSLTTYYDTNGAFDITVQPLVKAWGFGVTANRQLPDSQNIQTILKCIGSDKIRIEGNRIIKTKPCITIDVNGIAQGYSVDVIADYLISQGIKNFIVELGGEIRVSGKKQPADEKMKIGIEAPGEMESENGIMQKIISIDSGAITTSGSYRKYYESEGKKINHIIDPLTGYPVNNELISVTVFAHNAITADAYDNALMLMGLKKALEFVEKRKELAAHFIYRDNNGKIADTASSRFMKFIVK